MGIFSKQEKLKLKGIDDITFTVHTERTGNGWKVWVVEDGYSHDWKAVLNKNKKGGFSFRWEAKGWGKSRVRAIRKQRRKRAEEMARRGTEHESFKM